MMMRWLNHDSRWRRSTARVENNDDWYYQLNWFKSALKGAPFLSLGWHLMTMKIMKLWHWRYQWGAPLIGWWCPGLSRGARQHSKLIHNRDRAIFLVRTMLMMVMMMLKNENKNMIGRGCWGGASYIAISPFFISFLTAKLAQLSCITMIMMMMMVVMVAINRI